MAFNCIVDDSALLAGAKDDAKDSIKQWITDGAVNAFVPLYTLEKLNLLRNSNTPESGEAFKALEWLDYITEWTGKKAAGRVQLQGPEDLYETWQEVEKYLLPDTPFSSLETSNHLNDLTGAFDRAMEQEGNTITSDTRSSSASSRQTSKSTLRIPAQVRPLLNFVVWRSHHEDSSIDASGHYILLTNDPLTQKQAQKFGVRAKLLHQLGSVIAKTASKRCSTQAQSSLPSGQVDGADAVHHTVQQDDEDEDDEEVVFQPSQRPGSSKEASLPGNVFDPDSFGRSPNAKSRGPRTAQRGDAGPRRGGASRASTGSRGVSSTTRPAGSSARGRDGARGQQNVHVPTGPAASRGAFSPKSRAAQLASRTPRQGMNKPIDPDSYARPPPTTRGRGGFRRLWEPT